MIPCTKCKKKFLSADSLAQHLKDKVHSKQKAKANPTPVIATRDKLQTATSQATQRQVHTQDPHPVKPTPATSASNAEQRKSRISPTSSTTNPKPNSTPHQGIESGSPKINNS
jgi:hypothetical protein